VPDRPTPCSASEIEVTPEMIKAGATVLLNDPFLNLGLGEARNIAEKIILCALTACSRKNL
jgi:hypothetical protein